MTDNQLLYEHFFVPLRDPKELKPGSDEWKEVLQRAIDSEVILKQSGAYKGVSYYACFDGYDISYHENYEDAYRASETLNLKNRTVESFLGWDESLFISGTRCPNFESSDEWFIKLMDAAAEKYPDALISRFELQDWRAKILKRLTQCIQLENG